MEQLGSGLEECSSNLEQFGSDLEKYGLIKLSFQATVSYARDGEEYDIPYDLTNYPGGEYEIVSIFGNGYRESYSCSVLHLPSVGMSGWVKVLGYSGSKNSPNAYPNAILSIVVVLRKR